MAVLVWGVCWCVPLSAGLSDGGGIDEQAARHGQQRERYHRWQRDLPHATAVCAADGGEHAPWDCPGPFAVASACAGRAGDGNELAAGEEHLVGAEGDDQPPP